MAHATAQTTRSPNDVGAHAWKRFTDGGLSGVSEAVILEGGQRVKLSWADGHESEFSLKWMRDHCDGSFHVNTKQRKVRCRRETAKRKKKQSTRRIPVTGCEANLKVTKNYCYVSTVNIAARACPYCGNLVSRFVFFCWSPRGHNVQWYFSMLQTHAGLWMD